MLEFTESGSGVDELFDENVRLKDEIQKLRAVKFAA